MGNNDGSDSIDNGKDFVKNALATDLVKGPD
jgi:hypothetical protein